MNNKRTLGTVNTQSVVNGKATPEVMSGGLEYRTRLKSYPELSRQYTYYTQTDNITTTERTIGMPSGASDDIVVKLTTEGQIQFSSSSAADTSAGTGAQTIIVDGLTRSGGAGSDWLEISETITMNGQTPVASTSTVWWRINKINVASSGSGMMNAGDIYVSPVADTPVSGVPTIGNTLYAMIAGYGNSTMGLTSVPSNRRMFFQNGNFWNDPSKQIRIHEFLQFDFAGMDNLTQYEVAVYPAAAGTFDYRGYEAYDEKSDVHLCCFTETGSATALTYYAQAVWTVKSKENI